MEFSIRHQETYSRGLLLLRTFLGWLYILVPHAFLLLFAGLWAAILMFLAFWAILFTGQYPETWFAFIVKLLHWRNRLAASMWNLTDEYPAFMPNGSNPGIIFSVPRPETVSRLMTVLRLLFGGVYVGIPHGFCLFLRGIASWGLGFLAWWSVLFTGAYPADWHAFNVGTLRWSLRVQLYLLNMTDEYPPFSGKE